MVRISLYVLHSVKNGRNGSSGTAEHTCTMVTVSYELPDVDPDVLALKLVTKKKGKRSARQRTLVPPLNDEVCL